MTTARICIVSSGCLSSAPRVEKEADALAAAGYSVHVLVCHTMPWMAEWDARLAAGKPWSLAAITWPPLEPSARDGLAARSRHALAFGARASTRMLQLGAEHASARLGAPHVLTELASSERLLPMAWGGRSIRAELFIAHGVAALPVAAWLARRNHARFAFDAEDDHLGEFPLDRALPSAARVIDATQARYLPQCAYVTAPSTGIAQQLAARYAIAPPTVVHNVFPWSLRSTLDGERRERQGAALSLYWYSQSLGLDRGLDDAIRAAGSLHGDFELHLRGYATDAVRDALLRLAREHGVESRVCLHPQVHPAELLSRTAEHDVGLALEQPVSRNRMHTVTNKLFFYLLAGLSVAATDTPGQRRVMRALPDAGFLYEPGDARALARHVQRWLDDPEALRASRAAALQAARSRWSWEHESRHVLQCVRESLG